MSASSHVLVDDVAGQVGVVRRQVEVAVAAERGQDDLLLAGLLARQRLPDAAASACVGSGAGTMPSVRANCTPAAKHSVCGMATASIRPVS